MSGSSSPLATWPRRLRVGVVEDDARSRETLVSMIGEAGDLSVVLVAANRRDALDLLPRHEVDVLIVDLGLPDGSGLDVIQAARAQWPACSVLVSTIFGDEAHVLRSIEAGAMGYLLKDTGAAEVVEEIRSIHAGGSPISPGVARTILARAATNVVVPSTPPAAAPAQQEPAAALSTRELQVLRHVSKGFTTEETARAMNVTRTTVLTFVRRIYAKLQVNTRAEAIHEAHRQGLLAD